MLLAIILIFYIYIITMKKKEGRQWKLSGICRFMGVLFHTMAFQQMHVSHMRRCPQDVQEKAVII